jgi:L-lactate utilization protein LutB
MNMDNAVKNLKARGFEVSRFASKKEARDYLAGQLQGAEIGMGGSMTLKEMGLYDALADHNTVWNHWVQPPEAARASASKAGIYITSANAVAETGEILNIDGFGNRVSATLYNKDRVYIVVGSNKFEETFDKALWRARNIASPKNAQRLGVKTPCAEKGDKCYDCRSPERICKGLVVLWGNMNSVGGTEIVIVDETLGY